MLQTLFIHSNMCVISYALGMLRVVACLNSLILTTLLWKCVGNILIQRGNIDIQPPTCRTVSYEFLSQLVVEYLLTSSPGVDMPAALSVMNFPPLSS